MDINEAMDPQSPKFRGSTESVTSSASSKSDGFNHSQGSSLSDQHDHTHQMDAATCGKGYQLGKFSSTRGVVASRASMFEKKPATNQHAQTLPRRRIQQNGTVPQSRDDIDQEKLKIDSPSSSKTRRSRSMRLPGKNKPPLNAQRNTSLRNNAQPEERINDINRRPVVNKASPRTSSRGDITPTPSPPDSPASQPTIARSPGQSHVDMTRAQDTLHNGPSSPKQPPTVLPKPSRSQRSLVTTPPSPPWSQAARTNNHSFSAPRPKPPAAQKIRTSSNPVRTVQHKSVTSFSDAESHVLKTTDTLDLRPGVSKTLPRANISIKVTSSKMNNPIPTNTPKAIVIKVKPN